jgi:hypothetical protein
MGCLAAVVSKAAPQARSIPTDDEQETPDERERLLAALPGKDSRRDCVQFRATSTNRMSCRLA